MKIKRLHSALISLFLVFLSSPVFAQLTLRLDPEIDDPGTHSMPAQLGHAKSNDGSGTALQMALAYSVAKVTTKENLLYEPYVALIIQDNPAKKEDKKSLEVGVKSVYGDLTIDTAWLLDAALSKSKDAISGTESFEAKMNIEPVNVALLKHGRGYTSGEWGLFIRPKLGVYHLNTQETDDPVKSPLGRVSGAVAAVAVDLFPSFSNRTKLTISSNYAHDTSVSKSRTKDNYKMSKAQLEYIFYNAAEPPKGKALFSLVLERAIGRDPLSTSIEKKSTSAIYLGVKL